VHQVECRSRDARERLRLGYQPSQNAGAALGGLVGQDRAAIVARRHRLRKRLSFLELEDEPDAPHQRML
jgi:hypothetical protein